ncbi:MAG: endonuclease, partial [Leptospiraceae bacterium]|nr:endonuclease [Leptospiraceae bacterium]
QNKSGGEQAVIVEAISLGLALYKRQHSNADLLTLIRDETTAALTDENALLYLKMLRKAVSLGGFRQVLFVSHKTCLSELSDAIIRVGDGAATVSYTGEEAA